MMKTYKFRTLIGIEPERDIPSPWFFVIADSKDEAQGLALNHIKDLNKHSERLKFFTTKRFYSGAILEYIVAWGYINPYAINFDPAIHLN